MLWSFGRKRMVQRTCLDCGETRTLEASLARLRAGRPHGYGAGLRGGPVGQAIAEQQFAAATAGLDQELETIRQVRTCPKCGSERYKDRRF
jgi:predicted nucleic-acid-binding Zn-ribbon protein